MSMKAVILHSGGIDSACTLALAANQGYDCYALSFAYGQKHEAELIAATRLAKQFAKAHKILTIPGADIGGSALTDDNIAVPDATTEQKIKATYVPARNTIFLSFALGYAEVIGAYDIFIGANLDDEHGFPDCRSDYFTAWEKLANLATKSGRETQPFKMHAPLINKNKAEIIKLATELGVNLADTVTCYRADKEGRACGSCDSCAIRKRGFSEAGISDVTSYYA